VTAPDGRVLAIDQDEAGAGRGDGEILQSFGSRLIMEHSNFKTIAPLRPGTDFSK